MTGKRFWIGRRRHPMRLMFQIGIERVMTDRWFFIRFWNIDLWYFIS